MISATCPDCGAALPQGAPAGLCAACLLKLGEQTEATPTAIEEVTLTEGPGAVIGRYKLLEKLGEGGFGAVWAAEQREPVKRRVALKIIKLGMDTKQVVARFEAERQALALMDHPNIAKVLDAGTTDTGRPFFVMELVKGIPITKYCEHEKLGTKDRLDLFIKVCHAIQHAHQKGIIHRDIKPSNILVTLHDGVPVPKVIDFGIAKATQQELTELTIYTQHHQFIGTPAYMSPEQAEMSGLDIDTRSDIYSLGVLLYELLTGKTPFDAKELMQAGIDAMRRIIREQEPVRPSTKLSQTLAAVEVGRVAPRAPGKGESLSTSGAHGVTRPTTEEVRASSRRLLQELKGDLDWIVMKCLEKDRTRRYETANGLATDLRRHLSNEPVVARPPSAAYQFQKAWRRNKLVFTAGAAVAVALMIGLLVATVMWRKAHTAERDQSRLREIAQKALTEEEQQRRKANTTADELRSTLYAAEMNAAYDAYRAGSISRCRELLDRQREPARSDLRGFEWRWLWRQTRPSERAAFSTGKAGVTSIDYSPDGRRLLTLGENLKLWNADSGELIQAWDHGFGYSASFIGDGKQLISTECYATTVYLWDAETGRRLGVFAGHPQPVLSATVSGDGHWLAVASSSPYRETDAQIVLWDFPAQKQVETLMEPGSQWVFSLRFSPDGRLLAAGCGDGQIRLWDVATRRIVGRLTGHRGLAVKSCFTSDGKRLVSTGLDRTVRLWDVAERREITQLGLHEKGAVSIEVSADDRWAVTTGMDHLLKVWDLKQPGWVRTLRGHESRMFSAALHPDGRRIASADANGMVRLWDRPTVPDDWVIETPDARCFGFARGTRLLLGLAADSHVDVWDVAARQRIVHTKGWNPAWIPGTQTLLYNLEEDWFELDVLTGVQKPLPRLAEETTRLGGVTISPNGRLVALAHESSHVHVFDRTAQREVARLDTGPDGGDVAAFSADGGQLATAKASGAIQLWDVRRWQPTRRIAAHTDTIYAIRFAKTGELASSSSDGSIHLASRTTDRNWRIRDDEGDPTSLAIAPDGRTLAVGTFDGALKLWNLPSRQQVIVFEAGSSIVRTVAFSADGNALASTTYDGKVRVWQAPGWEDIQSAEQNNPNAVTSTARTGEAKLGQ